LALTRKFILVPEELRIFMKIFENFSHVVKLSKKNMGKLGEDGRPGEDGRRAN
jgi:hypothetical protein